MTRRFLLWLVEQPCWLFHRLWWVPGLNRTVLFTCPLNFALHRSRRFRVWYERDLTL